MIIGIIVGLLAAWLLAIALTVVLLSIGKICERGKGRSE